LATMSEVTPLALPRAVKDNPLMVLFDTAPALSVYPMLTASEQPLPEVAAVVACAILTTRYIPGSAFATRFVAPADVVCCATDTLPKIVELETQLPFPLIACRLSQAPTPE